MILLVKFVVRFCDENSNQWLWKKPYTTNQVYRAIKSFEDVIIQFKYLKKKWSMVIPYVFLQACLSNRMEYNVVCLNGVALYEAKIDRSAKPEISFDDIAPATERKVFAETVIRTLSVNRPETLTNGLFRVDIMWCDYLSKMIVIELESLEANHSPAFRDNQIYFQLHEYLGVHYANSIIKCLSEVLKMPLQLVEYPFIDISITYNKTEAL